MVGDRADAPASIAAHWDQLYADREADELSWTQDDAGMSAELVDSLAREPDAPIVDVGGGAGVLVDHLLANGHRRITILDASAQALRLARQRVERSGHPPGHVEWIVADIRTWRPPRSYALWHDRAVFHFLTDPHDRARYRERAGATLDPGGCLVIGTFAEDGPGRCSGLLVRRYGSTELADQFAPDFALVDSRRELHRTPWGATQPFTWVVLRRRS